jgi:hypothetical protein
MIETNRPPTLKPEQTVGLYDNWVVSAHRHTPTQMMAYNRTYFYSSLRSVYWFQEEMQIFRPEYGSFPYYCHSIVTKYSLKQAM